MKSLPPPPMYVPLTMALPERLSSKTYPFGPLRLSAEMHWDL